MSGCRQFVALIVLCAAAGISACAAAPRRIELPGGAGTPFPDASAALRQAVEECGGVRTLRATLGLSGRAGSTRLRGNVDAGFEAPERVRLEGRHPLGRPVFILVADGPQATLYMPRDNLVLRNAKTAEIVEALVGLPLNGAELRTLVSGCGFGAGTPGSGRSYAGGWLAIDSDNGTPYLREITGRWRLVAAARSPLVVLYSDFADGRPSTLRLESSGSPAADVSVRLSDVNINAPLEAEVFQVDVPANAQPLALDELRRAGPLGDR